MVKKTDQQGKITGSSLSYHFPYTNLYIFCYIRIYILFFISIHKKMASSLFHFPFTNRIYNQSFYYLIHTEKHSGQTYVTPPLVTLTTELSFAGLQTPSAPSERLVPSPSSRLVNLTCRPPALPSTRRRKACLCPVSLGTAAA